MDVRLPDGTVLQNVPEGTTQAQLLQKLKVSNHPAFAAINHAMAQEQVENDPITQGAKNFAKDMPWYQKFPAAYGKAAPDAVAGIRQLFDSGAPTLSGLVTGDKRSKLQQEIDEQKRLDEPLMHTVSGFLGNVAGNSALYAPTAAIPGSGGLLGSAAIGGASGALQPTATGESRATNTLVGAGAGMAGQTLGRALQSPTRTLVGASDLAKKIMGGPKSLVEPLYEGGQNQIMSRVLNQAAGENSQGAIANLRNARSLVAGSKPTAGEVAGSPGIASLQRTAAAMDPEAYATRAASNNDARVGALLDMAGTSGERDFAAANRSATAEDLYKQAYSTGVDLKRSATSGQFLNSSQVAGRTGEITKLLRTPALQKAVKEAQTLARNEMVNIGDPGNSVKGMDYLKRALDDQISNATGNEQRILVGLKNRLLTTIDTLSPEYAAARKVFSDMSKPISQMDIAQQIADKSIRPLDQTMTGHAYARALSDDTAQAVTGMRNATLESSLEPHQLATLNAIKQDLANSQFLKDAGRGPGSDTFQKLSMSNMMNQSGLPLGLTRMPGLGRFGDWVYGRADTEMRNKLSQLLLDPQETAKVMGKTALKQPPANQLTQIFQRPPDNEALIRALQIGLPSMLPAIRAAQ